MEQVPHTQSAGFTLIEILVGVALIALLFVSLTAVVARSAQASRTSSVNSMNNTSITKIGEQLGDDLSRGTNILHRASTTTLDLYRLGERIPLQQAPGADRFGKKTVTFLGSPFAALVGKPVIITNNRGKYVRTQVISSTTSGTSSTVTMGCNLSLEGTLTAYPYKTLSFDGTSNLTRTENGIGSVVAQNVKYVKFEPMYGQTAGTFPTSSSSPVMHKDGQALSMINYGVVGLGDPQVTAIGSARVNLAALTAVDCDDNPSTPANNLGKLQVNVLLNGEPTAPAGLNPNVTVIGPQALNNITTFDTRVFERLTAGTYTASAPLITSGSTIYDPTITNNPGTVGDGRQATINVNYKVRKGRLQLQIVGLPDPTPGSGTVSINGPDPQSIPAANGTTPVQLTPGGYTITATPVGGYIPTVSQPSLTVTSSTNTTVTVTYTDPNALLTLQVNGLPAGTVTTLDASGPEYRSIDVTTASSTSTSLQKGTYTITAPDKTVNGVTYSASPAVGSVYLGPGGATYVVTYTAPPISPQPPTSPTSPQVPPISPQPPAGTVRFKIGAAPPNGTYVLTAYDMKNGKLQLNNQAYLGEYTNYDLPDSNYYIVTLNAPSTKTLLSQECDVDSSTDPFANCSTAKPGDKATTQTVSQVIDWALASDNQPSNVTNQAATTQNATAYKYRSGSTTNFFGSGCNSLVTETRTGPVGSAGKSSQISQNQGCTTYNPINITTAEVTALVTAITNAVPNTPNLNSYTFSPDFDYTATYVPLANSFSATGLNAAQRALFNRLTYYVELQRHSKQFRLNLAGCNLNEFKNCPN